VTPAVAPTPAHLAQAVATWGLDAPPTFLRKVSNFVYAGARAGERVILRLTEPSYRARGELEAELHFLAFLTANGTPAALPLPTRAGALVTTLAGEDAEFHASLFRHAPGREMSEPAWFTAEIFAALGRLFGRMHRLTQSYAPDPWLPARAGWRDEAVLARVHAALDRRVGAPEADLDAPLAWLASLERPRDAYGLVHGDLHHGNFFVADAAPGRPTLTAFDFDDCCEHWFAYDLAVPLFNVFYAFHRRRLPLDRGAVVAALLAGYAEEHRLDDVWVERLPAFLRFRTTLILHWCEQQLRFERLSDNAVAWCREAIQWSRDELRQDAGLAAARLLESVGRPVDGLDPGSGGQRRP
jgi:Ser/Thr protein kinase RdoA (MazF antagonist)